MGNQCKKPAFGDEIIAAIDDARVLTKNEKED